MSWMERSAEAGDRPRRWSGWDTLALLLDAAVVSIGLLWHDPWADEAQAWLIARSMGFWQIVAHGGRYEGSPALWHCFLHLLILLHVSYSGMAWATGAMALAGIAIFLRWSPFPPILRLLLPLTFWLAYQDAVIARSYVLFTPLGFAAAALLRNRAQRPILLAVILALCANISLHGFLAALGLAAVALMQAWRSRSRSGVAGLGRNPAGIAAALILLTGVSVAVFSAYPPQTSSNRPKEWTPSSLAGPSRQSTSPTLRPLPRRINWFPYPIRATIARRSSLSTKEPRAFSAPSLFRCQTRAFTDSCSSARSAGWPFAHPRPSKRVRWDGPACCPIWCSC